MGIHTAGGQKLHAVPDFGDLAEHHGAAAADNHIGGVTGAGIGGDAAEGIAAAALHPDQQFADGQLFPAALFQFLQLFVGHIEDGLHHGIVSGVILQGQDVFGVMSSGGRTRS